MDAMHSCTYASVHLISQCTLLRPTWQHICILLTSERGGWVGLCWSPQPRVLPRPRGAAIAARPEAGEACTQIIAHRTPPQGLDYVALCEEFGVLCRKLERFTSLRLVVFLSKRVALFAILVACVRCVYVRLP